MSPKWSNNGCVWWCTWKKTDFLWTSGPKGYVPHGREVGAGFSLQGSKRDGGSPTRLSGSPTPTWDPVFWVLLGPSRTLVITSVGLLKLPAHFHSFLCCSPQIWGCTLGLHPVALSRTEGRPSPWNVSAQGSQCWTKSFLCLSVAASENVRRGEGGGTSAWTPGKQCPFPAFALGVKSGDLVTKKNVLPFHNGKCFLSQIPLSPLLGVGDD